MTYSWIALALAGCGYQAGSFAHAPATAQTQRVTVGCLDLAIERRSSVVYLPGFWRPIMAIIRAIPEPVFRRIRL